MRVLIAEDDPGVQRFVAKGLKEQAYAVDTVAAGPEALEQAEINSYDVIILDVMLPGLSGFEVCRRLREAGLKTPVLMLTARDAVVDRVAGLEIGADDYLVKPFALEELLARVKALLRRRSPPDVQREIVCFADLELDTATRLAQRGERAIELSTTEYELLALFMRNPRIVLTRSVLMDRIWGNDFEGGENVLEVYIGHLRTKLEQRGEKRLIQTVRGAGYVLRLVD